jgi:hypothetical protein
MGWTASSGLRAALKSSNQGRLARPRRTTRDRPRARDWLAKLQLVAAGAGITTVSTPLERAAAGETAQR